MAGSALGYRKSSTDSLLSTAIAVDSDDANKNERKQSERSTSKQKRLIELDVARTAERELAHEGLILPRQSKKNLATPTTT